MSKRVDIKNRCGFPRFSLLYCLLLVICCMVLLAACGGSGVGTNQAQSRKTPVSTVTPTVGPGQQLLAQSAQLLTSARTLHGIFNSTLSGQLANGEVDSEVWRMTPDKSRALILKSTLKQFTSGMLIVSDGKQTWQYNPAQKLVYTGSASPASGTGTPGTRGNQNNVQALLLGAIQTIFTHSTATLLSSTDRVNGRPVYTVHVVPQSQSASASGVSFNYDGTVSLDKQTQLPLAIDLTVPGFARVQIAIPSLELNKPLDASLFTFKPPAGTKVEPFPSATGANDGSLTIQQAEQQAGYHLLSIPSSQTAYHLQSVDALGAPGNQIYTLTYTSNGLSFTISEGKALANLPLSGQSLDLRGTRATLVISGGTSTLSWTEKGIGIQITGTLTKEQVTAIAKLLV